MGKAVYFILLIYFSFAKCTGDISSFIKQFEDDYDDYISYNPITQIFGKKGLIMKYLYYGKELEYQEKMSRNYVDMITSKNAHDVEAKRIEANYANEKEKIDLANKKLEFANKMIEKGFTADEIKNILEKLG